MRRSNGLAEIEHEAWDDLLARLGCADVYLLDGFLESARVLEGGRPVLLHVADDGGDVVFPLLVRELPSGDGADVTTPYGYGGPVAAGPEPAVRRFWELYGEWCGANGVVTTFIRFHPLFANQRYASIHVERLAGTVGWRLEGPNLFEAMHPGHRRACRRASRAGVSVAVQESPDSLSGFVELYEVTMRRVEAAEFYFFPPGYWELLESRLRERLVLVEAEEGGEVVASALCFATPPWLHFQLGATSERGRELGASNLLFYETASWARERGFDRFHLGGGVGAREDSLLTFKRRFDPSGGLLDFAVGKAVHDPAAYRALTGRGADELDGFFPAYRAGR
ncbi:MAG: GNAT family N-acetyltransferase [Gaiellaceae bacterium]